MEKPSLKLIAEKLKISTATVSKALNDYPDVSQETKDRVLDMVQRLNFQPNKVAQNLRSKESKLIGFISPNVVHNFFSNVLYGVLACTRERGYSVVVMCSEDNEQLEKDHLHKLIQLGVDGILVSLTDYTSNYDAIKKVIANGVPIVLYDKISRHVSCTKVPINYKQAASEATQYLIDTGCKNVGHVRGVLNPVTTIDRFQGYKQALKDNGMAYDSGITFEAKGVSIEDGYALADEIVNTGKKIDGILAHNDLLAIGLIKRFKELNVQVPSEISVIGFSDSLLTRVNNPSLTTVKQHGFDMGYRSAEVLIEEIRSKRKNEKVIHEMIEIPSKLIIRNSTKELIQEPSVQTVQ